MPTDKDVIGGAESRRIFCGREAHRRRRTPGLYCSPLGASPLWASLSNSEGVPLSTVNLVEESLMKHQPLHHTGRGQLSLVYSDRVVSRRLGADATLGDVAEVLGELGPRHLGRPVAIDVTMSDLRAQFPASHFMPVGMTYEDDPAAEFEDVISRKVTARAPVHAAQFRA
jgi:hypothetical protein